MSQPAEIYKTWIIDFAQDADANDFALWTVPTGLNARVISGTWASGTTIAAADTNYDTYALTDGTTTIASVATGPAATGQAFTAGTPVAMTVTDVLVDAAGVFHITKTKTGTGTANAGMIIDVVIGITSDQ
jgi:hypothetical protein